MLGARQIFSRRFITLFKEAGHIQLKVISKVANIGSGCTVKSFYVLRVAVWTTLNNITIPNFNSSSLIVTFAYRNVKRSLLCTNPLLSRLRS